MSVEHGNLKEKDWNHLIGKIKSGECTPFIGAGACDPFLPLGGQLANDWANRFGYPLKDTYDLPKVAQFMAIDNYDMFPKDRIRDDFRPKPKPDFSEESEPHGILADLGLPIYITTNYDNFMFEALRSRKKDPKREICRWSEGVDTVLRNKQIDRVLGSTDKPYNPSSESPLVYHLHGYWDIPQTIIITENDYLDFLLSVNEADHPILPPEIRIALTTNALLFVGYSLADWNFRVLFRSLFSSLSSMTPLIVAVQLRPEDVRNEQDAIKYLSKYFGSLLVKSQVYVYWGKASEFALELRKHWETGNP